MNAHNKIVVAIAVMRGVFLRGEMLLAGFLVSGRVIMIYIESPTNYNEKQHSGNAIFLAGGITDCPDWQQEMASLLKDTDLVLLNPRRANFPIHDPNAAREQIMWEHRHLNASCAVSFWFSPETLNPIVLYELGTWSKSGKPIFVGVHPDYKRRQDVEIQTALERPEVEIVYSLQDLASQLSNW